MQRLVDDSTVMCSALATLTTMDSLRTLLALAIMCHCKRVRCGESLQTCTMRGDTMFILSLSYRVLAPMCLWTPCSNEVHGNT